MSKRDESCEEEDHGFDDSAIGLLPSITDKVNSEEGLCHKHVQTHCVPST